MPEKAYYYPAPHDLGMLGARPSADGTKAIVDLGGRAGTLWFSDPADARQLLAAAFEAVRILDPDGAADAVFALIEGDALAKIRARILEEDAAPAPEAVEGEHFCGTWTTDEHDSPFGCTAVLGHMGDHVAYGGRHEVCFTWPQDAAPDTAQPEDIPEPVLSCWKCGATEHEAPLVDAGALSPVLYRCSNRITCGERQAKAQIAGAR